MAVYPYYPEADIGIALRTVPYVIRFFTAAIVTFEIPTAAFDDIQSRLYRIFFQYRNKFSVLACAAACL